MRALLPRWLARTLAYAVVALVAAAVCWVLVSVLVRVGLAALTVAIALLVTAGLWPAAARLRRRGLPPGTTALVVVLALGLALSAATALVWMRISSQVEQLVPAVTAGVDDIRSWLITGPLSMDPSQVTVARDQVLGYVDQVVPDPVRGARLVLALLAALVLTAFTVFFLLKDGPRMWAWALERTPAQHRWRVDGAGRAAWATVSGYATGVAVVALIDAALIGAALLVLEVPLWLTLTLLVFLGALVPILGATLSGAVAVLVTLVTNGGADAVVVLVVVLVVQQVEGNLLQPLVMRRAVHLHPVVTLLVVTSGTLLAGVTGAVLAVPLTATAYQVAEHLRTHRGHGPALPGAAAPGAAAPEPAAPDAAASDAVVPARRDAS